MDLSVGSVVLTAALLHLILILILKKSLTLRVVLLVIFSYLKAYLEAIQEDQIILLFEVLSLKKLGLNAHAHEQLGQSAV